MIVLKNIQAAAKKYPTVLFLGGLVIAVSLVSPLFLTGSNIAAVLLQASSYGIMACGMTFAIIGGEFDLSVGSTLALCGLISILLEPLIGQVPAIIVALFLSCLIGLLNGLLVNIARISSFIVTIGTSSLIKGIALRISGGKPVISGNPWFGRIGSESFLGAPNMVWFFLFFSLISYYVLAHTRFGRNIYVIGGNREVAAHSGIQVRLHGTAVFVLSAFTAGVAGILLASRLNTGSALHGDAAALTVISGVVIGGTSLSGGRGSIVKSILGIMIMTIIANSLDLLKVYSYYQMVIRGVIVVWIIGFDSYSRYKLQMKDQRQS